MSNIAKNRDLAILARLPRTLRYEVGNLARLPSYRCWQSWSIANRPPAYGWQSCILANQQAKTAKLREIRTYSKQGCKVANYISRNRWQPWKIANLKKLAILICRAKLQEYRR